MSRVIAVRNPDHIRLDGEPTSFQCYKIEHEPWSQERLEQERRHAQWATRRRLRGSVQRLEAGEITPAQWGEEARSHILHAYVSLCNGLEPMEAPEAVVLDRARALAEPQCRRITDLVRRLEAGTLTPESRNFAGEIGTLAAIRGI